MPTPYIYETDVNSLDWINELKYAYSLGRKELKKRGKSGHDWVTSNEARMTA